MYFWLDSMQDGNSIWKLIKGKPDSKAQTLIWSDLGEDRLICDFKGS